MLDWRRIGGIDIVPLGETEDTIDTDTRFRYRRGDEGSGCFGVVSEWTG